MKVVVKDIPVRYNGKSYAPGETVEIDQKHFDEKIFDKEGDSEESVDYYTLSAKELEKVNNDKLKAFLDEEGIEYDSSAKKADFIKLITGEEE